MRHQLQYDNDMKEITVDICLTQELITETEKKHAFKSNAQLSNNTRQFCDYARFANERAKRVS